MSTELTLPKGFGAAATIFKGRVQDNDELGAGVASSYAIMGFRGKVWATKYQGKETQLLRDDGDGARGSIEVVIIKSAAAISKIYYKGGYTDGSSSAPDCWSSNGVTPNAYVQNKTHPTCADCPMNAWGSRVTESGKPGKACSDSRRIAIVPVADIDNEALGGPMLLRIPAATLKDLKAYGELLKTYGHNYYGVATRISFDPKEAYPKLVFSPIRPLTEEEGQRIIALREERSVQQLLNEETDNRAAPAAEERPALVFEEQAPAPVKAVVAKPAPVVAKPAPVVVEQAEEEVEAPVASANSESFDDLLDSIL